MLLTAIAGLLCSCNPNSQLSENPISNTEITSSDCPESPSGTLSESTSLDLKQQSIQTNGKVKRGEDIGFVFQGKKGKNLRYSWTGNICIWVYAPDNSLLVDDKLQVDGPYTMHVASQKRSTDYEIILEFSKVDSIVPSTDLIANNSSGTTELSAVLDTIENYLESKPQIFAPPFNTSLVEKNLTGKRYNKAIESMQWLSDNNAYYTYDVIRIDKIKDFSVTENKATLYVTLTQHLTLYLNGKVERLHSTDKPKARDYYFTMEKNNGIWKISDIENLF